MDDQAEIPDEVTRFWLESNKCLSVEAFHAAAVMLRNVLNGIADDVGGTTVQACGTLDVKLKKLAEVKPETAFLGDYMIELKAIGNAGAHPESWPEVKAENAEVAREVARYLIEVLYEQPQRIARNILRRRPR